MTSVHLTNAYHPTSGGIRTFYHALLDAANREQRRVALVVPGARTEILDRGTYGRIYVVEAPRAPLFDRRYRLLLPHRYFPGTGSTVIDILDHVRPDVVEICDKYSLPYLAAMLRKRRHPRVRRPTLVGLSCERFDDNMAAYVSASAAGRAFTRWYIRHIYGPPFDAHIANSEYTAGELRDALPERASGFIRVCPMGVDADAFGPEHRDPALRRQLLRRCGGGDTSVLLLYAGRLSPEKNLGLLVETMQALARCRDRDYRMVTVGDGPLTRWLRAQAAGPLGGRLSVWGSVARDALAACCASADVFVHPNPREPFGIGPLEAMASGVPVVAPEAGGVLEYANRSNAWLAAPSAEAFADAVRSAAGGDARRLLAARATAFAFAWVRTTRRYFSLCDELHRLQTERWPPPVRMPPRLGNARRTMHA
jgi:alpha-1,6-mannosyltransferase